MSCWMEHMLVLGQNLQGQLGGLEEAGARQPQGLGAWKEGAGMASPLILL